MKRKTDKTFKKESCESDKMLSETKKINRKKIINIEFCFDIVASGYCKYIIFFFNPCMNCAQKPDFQ